jgi:hypothetical protein
VQSNIPEGFRPEDRRAPDKAYTDHTNVTFSLKEGPQGKPLWVMIEPYEPGLPVLKAGDAFLGPTFRDDVSFEEAKRFATDMRNKLCSISYTKFIT